MSAVFRKPKTFKLRALHGPQKFGVAGSSCQDVLRKGCLRLQVPGAGGTRERCGLGAGTRRALACPAPEPRSAAVRGGSRGRASRFRPRAPRGRRRLCPGVSARSPRASARPPRAHLRGPQFPLLQQEGRSCGPPRGLPAPLSPRVRPSLRPDLEPTATASAAAPSPLPRSRRARAADAGGAPSRRGVRGPRAGVRPRSRSSLGFGPRALLSGGRAWRVPHGVPAATHGPVACALERAAGCLSARGHPGPRSAWSPSAGAKRTASRPTFGPGGGPRTERPRSRHRSLPPPSRSCRSPAPACAGTKTAGS